MERGQSFGDMQLRSGQSSLELLIALAIFTLGISAVIALIFGGQALVSDADAASRALLLARGDLESAAANARNNFPAVVSASSTQDIFMKQLTVEDLDANTKRVTSRVSWQSDSLRSQSVGLIQILTNWRVVKAAAGDTGGGDPSGDWKNPQSLGSIDLGPGNSATDLDVFQKIVYLTAQASDAKKPDFFVVDATSGQNPQTLQSLNTGPGLNALDVAGSYAYAANDAVSGQLQIINISDIRSTTTLASSFTLPGVSGSGATGESIFYSGGKAYLGTQRASGPEFHVVDVSDPSSPAELGSFEVGADVNMIQVSGNYAYLATSDDAKELRILNVSDPAAIAEIGSFNAAGSEDALALYLYGSTLYLGRASAGDPELYILNAASPGAIATLGSKSVGADVTGIRIRQNLLFMGTADSNKEFQIWDISNPANMTLWGSFNFPQVATGIDYEDNLVYVSVRSNDAVRIITSSP
jgi:hypothetical protein